ncbi:MAG: hypothetical protein RJA90_2234 [Bacteroidota bacterium]
MVRRIYRYLRGTVDYGLIFPKGQGTQLEGYCDSSFANLESYRSLSGHLFLFGKSPVMWAATRQPIVAKSTEESEYVALTPALQDCIWAVNLLNELGFQQEPVVIKEDNEACIALANNPQSSKRTRHIQVRYHWVREKLEEKFAVLESCRTVDQLADIFTKGIHGPGLKSTCQKIGLKAVQVTKQEKN